MNANDSPSDWTWTTLGEIADKEGYGLVDGPFGSNLPASCYVEYGIPVIRGSNLSLGSERFISESFVYVSNETAEKLARSKARPNDIIFTKKGTLGQTGFVPGDSEHEEFLISSNQMKLSVDEAVAYPLYVYYYVSSKQSQEKIKRDSEFTGVPKTNIAYLKTFPILLPPLSKQLQIADILASLENKIELNRRLNLTLEAIAQAIFQSWFVDFDPVRAKQAALSLGYDPERAAMATLNGTLTLPNDSNDISTTMLDEAEARLDELSAEQRTQLKQTAALFPSRLVESELGLIPEGWDVKPFGDFLSKTIGGDWGKDAVDEKHTDQTCIIRGTDIPKLRAGYKSDAPIRYVQPKKLKSRKLEPWDIVIEVSGGSKNQPTGRSMLITEHILDRLGRTVEPASFCRLFRPTSKELGLYLSLHLDRIYEAGKTWLYQVQSTGISNFQTKAFLSNELVVGPPPNILKAFYMRMNPIAFFVTRNENVSLEELRDTLLPKLLSGELSVSDVESTVA